MPSHPKLRMVEPQWVNYQGQQYLHLSDPLQLAKDSMLIPQHIILLVADASIENSVVVSSNEVDTDPANNEASVVTEVALEVFDIILSQSADRSGQVPLDGETVSGDIYVFTNTGTDVDQVRFFLDGEFFDDENIAPHDLVGAVPGTDLDRDARPFDTTELNNGTHSLVAEIDLDGDTLVVESMFEVDNS